VSLDDDGYKGYVGYKHVAGAGRTGSHEHRDRLVVEGSGIAHDGVIALNNRAERKVIGRIAALVELQDVRRIE